MRVFVATVCACAIAALVEEVFELRARARLTGGETFASVDGAQVRYRLLGAEHKGGATVVFLTGLGGSIEQMQYVQARVASTARALAYDRGGYGFSVGSHAHTAEEQVRELDGLLRALHLDGPVVLVGFSLSASIARVFAAHYPERTAGLYFVEPYLPELEQRVPSRKPPRRTYIRWIVHDLVTSTLGLKRLENRLANWAGPASPVERRAEEVLQSRRHFWALAHEWYAIPVTAEETVRAPVGREPVVILFTEQPDSPTTRATDRLFEQFVHRSPRGILVKLPNYDHAKLITPGPVLDVIVHGISALAQSRP